MKTLPAENRSRSRNGDATAVSVVTGDERRLGPEASWVRVAALGYGLIILTFGVLGGWAAIAKIDKAVSAPGVVAIDTNHKTVQHLEGGIVREILVKEGEAVAQEAVLFRFENVQAKADYEVHENQLHALLAAEARLIAERDDKGDIAWPHEIAPKLGAASGAEAWDNQVMEDQTAEFNCEVRRRCSSRELSSYRMKSAASTWRKFRLSTRLNT